MSDISPFGPARPSRVRISPALGPQPGKYRGIEALAVDQDVAGSALSYLTALLDAVGRKSSRNTSVKDARNIDHFSTFFPLMVQESSLYCLLMDFTSRPDGWTRTGRALPVPSRYVHGNLSQLAACPAD